MSKGRYGKRLMAIEIAEKVVHKGGHATETGLSKKPYFAGLSVLDGWLGESSQFSAN